MGRPPGPRLSSHDHVRISRAERSARAALDGTRRAPGGCECEREWGCASVTRRLALCATLLPFLSLRLTAAYKTFSHAAHWRVANDTFLFWTSCRCGGLPAALVAKDYDFGRHVPRNGRAWGN